VSGEPSLVALAMALLSKYHELSTKTLNGALPAGAFTSGEDDTPPHTLSPTVPHSLDLSSEVT